MKLDIEAMAIDADPEFAYLLSDGLVQLPELEAFARLIVEKCAAACDQRYMGDNNREDMEARKCAAAIRDLVKDEG